MGWYDLFAHFYDGSLERHYRQQRGAAFEALQLEPGQTVLDLPCGTGQSFDEIAPALGNDGLLLGFDQSSGMLAKARQRAETNAWSNIRLRQADVHSVTLDILVEAAGRDVQLDRLHIFLGLSAFPNWEDAFERLWNLLRPGGRCVVVDVHSEVPSFQGRMVNLVARADIRRRTWEPLERLGTQFERTDLPSTREHGGQLFMATAIRDEL